MKLFECQACGQPLYFENTRCERCGRELGYLPERTTLSALEPADEGEGEGIWRALAPPGGTFRRCANAETAGCNWMVPAGEGQPFCRACRLNRTIPDLGVPANLPLWQRLETAKRRLVYALLRLGLPLASKAEDPERGLAFDFLAGPDSTFREGPQVLTGHAGGVVTINIAEADDVARERHRLQMAEPYRTPLGHFRHEIGHYYWDRLVRDRPALRPFRERFGDERADYAAALEAHYAAGPAPDWQARHVSGYAGAHPWEDFAETWAHYMHIVDTLETAHAFGVRVEARAGRAADIAMAVDFDPYRGTAFDALVEAWLPLTYAVNSLNRSMGQPDLYPFVLSPPAVEKLRFVHGLVHGTGARRRRAAAERPGALPPPGRPA